MSDKQKQRLPSAFTERATKYTEYIDGLSSGKLSRKELADLRKGAYIDDKTLVDALLGYFTANCTDHNPVTQAVCVAINDVVADIKRAHYSDNTRMGLITVDYEGLKNNVGKEILS